MIYDMGQTNMDDVTIKLKSWWKSGTVLVNSFVLALAAFWDALPVLGNYVDGESPMRYVIGLAGAATIYMRVSRTNQAITLSAAEKPAAEDKVIVTDGRPLA